MSKEKFDILLVLISSTLALFFIAVVFVISVNKYQKKLLREQENVYQEILKAQEMERQRISQDLHDGLGGLLSNARRNMMELDQLLAHEHQKKELLNMSVALIDESIEEARNASNAIMPAALKHFGLKGAIKELVKKYQANFEIALINECPDELNELKQIHIYRLLNELFNNTQKYAQASLVELEIISDEHNLNIYFKDNGIGFNFDEVMQTTNRNGLKNISNRVALLKGHMKTNNNNGMGYTFNFNLQ